MVLQTSNDTCKFLLMGMIKFKTVSSGIISALTRHFSRLFGVKVKMSRTLLGHVLESLSQRKTLKTVKVIEGLLDVPFSLSCYRWQSFVEYESDSRYTAGTLALLSSMKPDSSDSLVSTNRLHLLNEIYHVFYKSGTQRSTGIPEFP